MQVQIIAVYASMILASIFGPLAIPQLFPEVLLWSVSARIVLHMSISISIILVIIMIFTFSKWIEKVKKISRPIAKFLFFLIFNPFARIFYLIIISIIITIISDYNHSIIILSGLAIILFLSSLKQFPLQEFKIIDRKEVIFDDDFENNRGWFLNYWGSTDPSKTNRIEDSNVIFEAKEEELLDKKKEFGAYIDLRNGIQEGSIYEISCRVKSADNTTMGFQLWIHDTIGGKPGASIKEPTYFYLPPQRYEILKTKYKATASNAIRIHLHNKGGNGKIFVDRVTVSKILT